LGEGFEPLEFGEGKAGPEGLDLALGRPWDLVIVAIDLPDREGLQVLTVLKKMRPDQPVLVLIVRANVPDAVCSLKADIDGHAEVVNTPNELVSAFRRVLASGRSGQSTMAREAPPNVDQCGERSRYESLSRREREVLRLVGLGRTVKEIAAVLALTETTISTYRSRILTKLGLTSTAELIRYAVINRLAD
jgi:DNA-binding NarL/FixJ family response regulator